MLKQLLSDLQLTKLTVEDLQAKIPSSHYLLVKKLSGDWSNDLSLIYGVLGKSEDVKTKYMSLKGFPGNVAIIYVDSMVSSEELEREVLRSLQTFSTEVADHIVEDLRRYLSVKDTEVVLRGKEISQAVLSGMALIVLEGHSQAIVCDVQGPEQRAVSIPKREATLFGASEGFTDGIDQNLSIIRKRYLDPNLMVRFIQVGRRSKTRVAVLWTKDLAQQELPIRVIKQLKSIDIDIIIGPGRLEEMLVGPRNRIFSMTRTTERPDAVVSGLAMGTVALLVDGSSHVIIIPTTFWSNFQSAEEYEHTPLVGAMLRTIRFIGWFLVLIASPLYISVSGYNPDIIPVDFVTTVIASRAGVPFPAVLEIILLELLMEVLFEAIFRMPERMSTAITIVGALVVGQAIVQARFVSGLTIIFVAASAVGIGVLTAYHNALGWRTFRWLIIGLSAIFGIYGLFAGLYLLFIYLNSLETYGVPYLSSVSPPTGELASDIQFRRPWWKEIWRPSIFKPKQKISGRESDWQEYTHKQPFPSREEEE